MPTTLFRTAPTAAMLTTILMLTSPALAQQEVDWDAVDITVHHVAGGVHYLAGRGGNIGLSIGEDGVVMIDDQYAPLTDRIVAAIGEVSNGDIRFVINTHVHPDHTGGNENLGKRAPSSWHTTGFACDSLDGCPKRHCRF